MLKEIFNFFLALTHPFGISDQMYLHMLQQEYEERGVLIEEQIVGNLYLQKKLYSQYSQDLFLKEWRFNTHLVEHEVREEKSLLRTILHRRVLYPSATATMSEGELQNLVEKLEQFSLLILQNEPLVLQKESE